MSVTQDLRLGKWEDVLAGVKCDAIIVDPPFGERTHSGAKVARNDGGGSLATDGYNYSHWSPEDVSEAVTAWGKMCAGWIVALTSHDLIPAWEEAYRSVGRYSFAPLACVMRGANVRLVGDGPANWSVYAMASRPRRKPYSNWGALQGAYVGGPNRDGYRAGGKPLWLMQALVRDYSRPGDIVCDPCAGGGTTLAAAQMEGRSSIGAECDPEAYAVAKERLAQRYQAVFL